MEYSLQRHQFLLRKNQEKALSDKEQMELSNYKCFIEFQMLWQLKDEFRQLFEDYLAEKLTSADFDTGIYIIRRKMIGNGKNFNDKLLAGEITNYNQTPYSEDLALLLHTIFFTIEEMEEEHFEKSIFFPFVQESYSEFLDILEKVEDT